MAAYQARAAISMIGFGLLGISAFGRVEPMTTQGCLPESCHSLNLGMENFASILIS